MSSPFIRFVLVLAILVTASARAAQVLSIEKGGHLLVVSQRATGAWVVDEPLCVLHEYKEVACGTVVESSADTAKLKLKAGHESVTVGDFVQAAPTLKAAGATAPPPLPKNVTLLHVYNRRFFFGLEAGERYAFPMAQFAFALDRRTCLAVSGGYWAISPSSGSELKGPGAMLSLSFYRTRCFQGLWLGIDVGGYSLSASANGVSGKFTTAAGGAGVGYETRLYEHLTLRLGFSARYLTNPRGSAVSYPLDPWLYFFTGGLGWQF